MQGDIMSDERPTSRIDRLHKHYKALQTCLTTKSMDYYDIMEETGVIIDQYLAFDTTLPTSVATLLTSCYRLTFQAIRHHGQGRFFKEIYRMYHGHRAYLQGDLPCAEIAADLSFIFWMLNDLKQSLKQGKRSVQLLEKCGNTTTLTGRYSNIGYIYECLGDLQQATIYHQLSLQYGLRIKSDEVLILAYIGLGRVATMRGKIKQAVHFYLEARDRITDHQSDNYYSVNNNLGIAYGSMGMHQQALECFEPFITQQIKREDPDTFITFSINAANSYKSLNQLDTAEVLLRNALHCATALDYYNDLAAIMISLGNIMNQKQEYHKALDYYEKAQEHNTDAKSKRQHLITLQGSAQAHIGLHMYSQALQTLQTALPIAEEIGLLKEQAKNHNLQSQAMQALGNFEEAFYHYKQCTTLEMQIKNEEHSRQMEELKTQNQQQPALQRLASYTTASLISQELQKQVSLPLVGCSKVMQDVVSQALLAAKDHTVPVLITGESGSGKEAIARIIHHAGMPKDAPFVSVNSAAFTASLIDSAFFGYEKGAYTGASSQKLGYFETASGGTLFLDEIGDMPIEMQTKFLRVIEEKVLHRIGSTNDVPVDFRLISATHKDLSALTESHSFRFDLLNRIHVMEIHVPPLRERPEDIPLLVDYYLQSISSSQGCTPPIITKEAMDRLASYSFPGNVRELKNIIQRSLLLCQDSILDAEDICLNQQTPSAFENDVHLPSLNLEVCESWIIEKAMEVSGNHQTSAAQILGISPSALSRKLKRLREKNEG
jgi:two-component system response regulator PilR (NtrC family)